MCLEGNKKNEMSRRLSFRFFPSNFFLILTIFSKTRTLPKLQFRDTALHPLELAG